jgi:putative solute:sodium symporter small subunit
MVYHLVVWFVVGLVFTVLLVEPLNQWRIGGIPLGFWFAMQGAICVFVIQMFVYTHQMNRLDAKYGQVEDKN